MTPPPVDREDLVHKVTQLADDHESLVGTVRSLLDGVDEDLVGDEFFIRIDGPTARTLRRLTSGP